MTKAKTLADFRNAHDPDVIIPAKIKAGLAALLKIGPEHFEYEADFMKLADVTNTQIAAFRDNFAAHIVEAPGTKRTSPKRVYFGDPKVAAKLRK